MWNSAATGGIEPVIGSSNVYATVVPAGSFGVACEAVTVRIVAETSSGRDVTVWLPAGVSPSVSSAAASHSATS